MSAPVTRSDVDDTAARKAQAVERARRRRLERSGELPMFEVCVMTSIGAVYRDEDSDRKPDEAAYLLIAEHARSLPDDGHAEYRFPGHAQGMTTLVTVQNESAPYS